MPFDRRVEAAFVALQFLNSLRQPPFLIVVIPAENKAQRINCPFTIVLDVVIASSLDMSIDRDCHVALVEFFDGVTAAIVKSMQ